MEIIEELYNGITYIEKSNENIIRYKFKMDSETLTVTLYKKGKRKLLLQGKNSYLFQVFISTINELFDDSNIEQILESAYRINIKEDRISKSYDPILERLPENYPDGLKRLIKQSIINMHYYVESEDYSMYAYPALKALEGHVKYLLSCEGEIVDRHFRKYFTMDNQSDGSIRYAFKREYSRLNGKTGILNCYTFYKVQRDTLFHFGDIIDINNSVDNTRWLENKKDADKLIKECIDLIITER